MYVQNKRIVVKNKLKFTCFIFIVYFVGMISFNLIFSHKVEGYENSNMKIVIVGKGDTLWDIASKYSNNKNDIREEIYHVKKINDLETSYIHPGQELLVPFRE